MYDKIMANINTKEVFGFTFVPRQEAIAFASDAAANNILSRFSKKEDRMAVEDAKNSFADIAMANNIDGAAELRNRELSEEEFRELLPYFMEFTNEVKGADDGEDE